MAWKLGTGRSVTLALVDSGRAQAMLFDVVKRRQDRAVEDLCLDLVRQLLVRCELKSLCRTYKQSTRARQTL